jgi:hypothetical protein
VNLFTIVFSCFSWDSELNFLMFVSVKEWLSWYNNRLDRQRSIECIFLSLYVNILFYFSIIHNF